MLPAVVLAGGLGTRLASVTGDDRPKALVEVAGRPFIDWKLAELSGRGITDVLLLVGHHGDAIVEHVGDGTAFGVRARYQADGNALLGTGGAIRRALPDLPDAFWVTYGDSLLEVPMAEVEAFADESGVDGVMVVLENQDRWETSNVSVREGRVVAYEKGAPPGTHRFIDYGMLLLSARAFAAHAPGSNFDLGEVVRTEIDRERLGAWPATERFHDIGTEHAWRETDEWVRDNALWDRLQKRIRSR